MDYHYHARTTVHQRKQLAMAVIGGRLSAAKWVRRFRDEGEAGLRDRSCRPRCSPRLISDELVVLVESQRRLRWTGMRIARELGLSPATVSRVLRRLKLSRIRDLEPRPAVVRYEHRAPGDMVHFDIKRLVKIKRPSHRVTGDRRDGVKGIGAEFLHIAIDDHSRLAFTAMDPDQRETSATHFLAAATAWFQSFGIQTSRVLTDNGPCYVGRRFQKACHALGLKHRKTRPYTPRTNGNAERFIQTALREWAYAQTYQNSEERTAALISFTPSPTNTTGTDHMPVSTNNHPSPEHDSMTTIS
jgi:transposase InsO family protein